MRCFPSCPLPKAVFWEVFFTLAVGFWGQGVGPVSAHFLRAQRSNRMYSRIGIDPLTLMAKESQSLCRCVCSFAEKYQAVASWLTELPSCTKGHFHCPIVGNITPCSPGIGGVRSEGSEDNATGRWATALSLKMTSIWPLATNI